MTTRDKIFLIDLFLSLPGLLLLWWTKFDLSAPLGILGIAMVVAGLLLHMRYALLFSE